MVSLLEEYEDKLIRKNYSKNTRSCYLNWFGHYCSYCANKKLDINTEYEPYLKFLILKKYSLSSQNQAINAIKFYLEKMRGHDRIVIKIDRPRKEKRLPSVLSKKEIKEIIGHIRNIKHKAMISLIYACGFRVGELINLELKDINSERQLIHIRKGKGFKDRFVPIPESMILELRKYYKVHRPKLYLFEGQQKTKDAKPVTYSTTSLQKILKRAVIKSNIKRRITLHTLRHSYATHLYEHGIDLRSIQVLLGHNSSKTTEIYTHVATKHLSQLPSPIDFLDLKS